MSDQELINLTKNLLALQSYKPETSKVPEFIYRYLRRKGVQAKIIKRNGIKNIVSKTKGKKVITFNGHWDTVPPPSHKPKKLIVKENKNFLYGLGACDMKSGVASLVAAYIHCFQNQIPGVILCLVGDEEKGGKNGTRVLVDKKYYSPYVVLAEPTNLNVSLGQKGGMFVKIVAYGKSAHSAYPNRGINAITKIAKFVNELEKKYPSPSKKTSPRSLFNSITASVNTITGGTASNVVPEYCKASIDIRIPPSTNPKSVESVLKKLAKKLELEISINFLGEGWQLDRRSKLHHVAITLLKNNLSGSKSFKYIRKMGTNDGKYYAPLGCQIINIGPGDNKLSHTGKEKVSKKQLIKARNIYVDIANNLSNI